VYSPKIRDDLIPPLYQWAKRLEIPMTRLVSSLLAHAIERLEQGAEYVSEPPRAARPERSARNKGHSMASLSEQREGNV